MKQKEIKRYVELGMATDITHYNFEQANAFMSEHNLDTIEVSNGVYGMNGALFKDRETGEYYAITARNSTLFQMV